MIKLKEASISCKLFCKYLPYILLFNVLDAIDTTQKRCLARYTAALHCKDNMG